MVYIFEYCNYYFIDIVIIVTCELKWKHMFVDVTRHSDLCEVRLCLCSRSASSTARDDSSGNIFSLFKMAPSQSGSGENNSEE